LLLLSDKSKKLFDLQPIDDFIEGGKKIVPQTRKPSILVVGSVNMDLVLRTPRIPKSGESLIGEFYLYVPGGKGANQAVAAARLGASVTFVGRVGEDNHGVRLKEQFRKEGICTDFLRMIVKTRLVWLSYCWRRREITVFWYTPELIWR